MNVCTLWLILKERHSIPSSKQNFILLTPFSFSSHSPCWWKQFSLGSIFLCFHIFWWFTITLIFWKTIESCILVAIFTLFTESFSVWTIFTYVCNLKYYDCYKRRQLSIIPLRKLTSQYFHTVTFLLSIFVFCLYNSARCNCSFGSKKQIIFLHSVKVNDIMYILCNFADGSRHVLIMVTVRSHTRYRYE